MNPVGGVKQVDYLSGIIGLETGRIQARAPSIVLPPDITIRVLHPLDVLESRLRNLDSLPEKRNPVGVAQARLAIEVVRAFVCEMIDTGRELREVFKAVERIAQIALDTKLVGVAIEYKIDPLDAVPVSRIDSREFQVKRWPQIESTVAELKRKRMKLNADRATSRKTHSAK